MIDLQHGITDMPTAHPSEEIVARCAQLAEAFRANAKLVAATRVAFARDGGDVIKTRTAESPTAAVTDPDEGAHLNSLRPIFPRIAELATTEEVLTALARTI